MSEEVRGVVLAHAVVRTLARLVEARDMPYCTATNGHALLHSQAGLEADVDLHPLDPGLASGVGQRGEVGCPEIAAELVVELHGGVSPFLCRRLASMHREWARGSSEE